MEFANINETMRTAKNQDKRFIPLFGSETFRSWIIHFRPDCAGSLNAAVTQPRSFAGIHADRS